MTGKAFEYALALAQQGARVFPCHPGTKRPWVKTWKVATSDTEQIARWHGRKPDANWAVICGELFDVIDVDTPGIELTFPDLENVYGIVSTGSGGRHYYIPVTGRNVPQSVVASDGAGVALEIKGAASGRKNMGSYAMVPGCRTTPKSGSGGSGTYEVIKPIVLPTTNREKPQEPPKLSELASGLPSAVIELLKQHDRRHQNNQTQRTPLGHLRATGDKSEQAAALLERTAKLVREAVPGQRMNTLRDASFTMGGFIGAGLLDHDSVYATLSEAAQQCGLHADLENPEDCYEPTLSNGLRDGATKPFEPQTKATARQRFGLVPTAQGVPAPTGGYTIDETGMADYLFDCLGDELLTLNDGKELYLFRSGAEGVYRKIDRKVLNEVIDGFWRDFPEWDLPLPPLDPMAPFDPYEQERELFGRMNSTARRQHIADKLYARVQLASTPKRVREMARAALHWVNMGGLWFNAERNEFASHDPSALVLDDTLRRPSETWRGTTWETAVNAISGNDPAVADWLQWFFGRTLVSRPADKVGLILCGPAHTGKTMMLQAIEAALGTYGWRTSAQAILQEKHSSQSGHNEQLSKFSGKRFVFADEFATDAQLDPVRIKEICGNGEVNARPIFGADTKFPVTWRFAAATNQLPAIPQVDDALRKRLRILPVPERPDNTVNQSFSDAISSEEGLSHVLAWLVEGSQMSDVPEPAVITKATAEYFDGEVDVVETVLAETLELLPVDKVLENHIDNRYPVSKLHATYVRRVREQNLGEPMSSRAFVRAAEELGFTVMRKQASRIVAGVQLCFVGVKVLSGVAVSRFGLGG